MGIVSSIIVINAGIVCVCVCVCERGGHWGDAGGFRFYFPNLQRNIGRGRLLLLLLVVVVVVVVLNIVHSKQLLLAGSICSRLQRLRELLLTKATLEGPGGGPKT